MRFPKPFFRASKDAWYVQLGKRQISLGKDGAAEHHAGTIDCCLHGELSQCESGPPVRRYIAGADQVEPPVPGCVLAAARNRGIVNEPMPSEVIGLPQGPSS